MRITQRPTIGESHQPGRAAQARLVSGYAFLVVAIVLAAVLAREGAAQSIRAAEPSVPDQRAAAPREGGGPDETATGGVADWPLYTNVIHGYELRYPPGWLLQAPRPCFSPVSSASEIRRDEDDLNFHRLTIHSSYNDTPEDAAHWANVQIDVLRRGNWVAPPAEAQAMLGGIESVMLEGERPPAFGFPAHRHTYVVAPAVGLSLLVVYSDTPGGAGRGTLDAMLSTFRLVPEVRHPGCR